MTFFTENNGSSDSSKIATKLANIGDDDKNQNYKKPMLLSHSDVIKSQEFMDASHGLKVMMLLDIARYDSHICALLEVSDQVPLSTFFADIDCDDEGLIAVSIRKNTGLKLSFDSRNIVFQKQDHNWHLNILNTIYIEKYTMKINYNAIMKTFGMYDIKSIYIGKKEEYAFIVFETILDAQDVASKYQFPILNAKTNIMDFIKLEKQYKCGFIIMPYQEWHKRSVEYFELFKKSQQALNDVMEHSGTKKATFEDGVVCKFKGIHEESPLKVIKRLFEMVAPVSYVDLCLLGTENQNVDFYFNF